MTGFPWDHYFRLQVELLGNSKISDRNWAIEATLDDILAGKFADTATIDDDIERAISTAQRRERHRAMLRYRYLGEVETGTHIEAAAASAELQSIKKKVSPPNWRLLVSVAEGHDYSELAVAQGTTLGALRARVFRLRREVA